MVLQPATRVVTANKTAAEAECLHGRLKAVGPVYSKVTEACLGAEGMLSKPACL